MSWLDGFGDDAEAINLDNRIQRTDKLPEPDLFQNFGGALADTGELGMIVGWDALASSMTQLAGTEFASTLATGLGAGYTPGFDAERHAESAAKGVAPLVEAIGRDTASAVKELRPDPVSTGMAGQLLGGLAEIVPRYVVGTIAGGPLVGALAAGAPQGYAATQVAKSEGIDESTAIRQGVIEGVVTTVGAAMPGARLFKSVPADLAAVTGANVALGAAGRGATAELLEQRGYTAQAAQYRAFDGTAMLIDGVLGLAFGGIGRAGDIKAGVADRFRPTPEQVDAALTQRNAQHYALDTAPGIPTTPDAAVAHRNNMDAAVSLLQRDEPVRLSGEFEESAYLSRKAEHETLGDEVAAQRARFDGEERVEPTLQAKALDIGVAARAVDAGRIATEGGKAASEPAKSASAGGEPASAAPDSALSEAGAETPVQALARTATETPDFVVNVGEEGVPVYRSLSEAFDEIEVERARVEVDSRAYQAAINCALRWGN